MTDGPHKSLPMKPGWRKVAQRARNPAFTPKELAEAVTRPLLAECNAEFVRRVGTALNPTDQTRLFEESPQEVAARLHKLRASAPGSQFAENLLDATIYAIYHPAGGVPVLEAALPVAVHATAESAFRGIEEHGLRKEGRATADSLRNRLSTADGLLDYRAIGDQLMQGGSPKNKSAAPKHTGLDEGVSL